jgi:1-acyl-sn-glycerol-3-phosphate acyltransferase
MRAIFLWFLYGVLMRFFLRVIVGVKYAHKHVLKEKKQFILVANHNSHLDTMALMTALSFRQRPKTHPVAAGDYFGGTPIKAFISYLFLNAILIRRKKDQAEVDPIELMSEALRNGDSLILFPEGSRGEPEKMQEFKKGIGILLQRFPHVPYIPVYMKGMGKTLPKGETLLVPFDCYVLVGKPHFTSEKEVEGIVAEVAEEVLLLKELFDRETLDHQK